MDVTNFLSIKRWLGDRYYKHKPRFWVESTDTLYYGKDEPKLVRLKLMISGKLYHWDVQKSELDAAIFNAINRG